MGKKYERLTVSAKISTKKLIALTVLIVILATSSLVLNIGGVAEATHGGIHLVGGSGPNPSGTFFCPPPNEGTGSGRVEFFLRQLNDGQFEGSIHASPVIFPVILITTAETDGNTFTIRGSPFDSCADGSPPHSNTFTISGECGTGVTVTASVSNGARGTYQANVHCEGGTVNSLPTANAGADQAANEGDTVTLDGSASSDRDGTIASYSWIQTGGTPVTLSDRSTARPTFVAPDVGPEGATLTFELKVTDDDGATSTGVDAVNVKVNNRVVNQAPTAAATASPSEINEGETSQLDASGSSDPDTGDLLSYPFEILDNGPGTIADQTDPRDPTATYVAPSEVSSDQPVRIQVTVSDDKGGTDTEIIQILVKDIPDLTPPVINVPPDMTEEATSPQGSVVTYEVTAEDDVDGPIDDVSCNPASGSTFPLGETTIECTATDAAGNTGTGSFTVTIQDTTQPAISVPDDITVEATGPEGAAVSFADDVSSEDLVDGPLDVSCDFSSGETFPLGQTTTVTCSAEDSRGNSAAESFTITVQDTTAPDVEITDAIDRRNRAVNDGGTTPTPYIQISFAANDAVGVENTECSLDGAAFTSCTSPIVYDSLSRGDHQVTVRATDAAGNSGEDQFAWTVGSQGPPATASRGQQQQQEPAAVDGGEEVEVEE